MTELVTGCKVGVSDRERGGKIKRSDRDRAAGRTATEHRHVKSCKLNRRLVIGRRGPLTHRRAAGDWDTLFGPTLDASFNTGAESAVHRRPHVSFLQGRGNTTLWEHVHLFIRPPFICSHCPSIRPPSLWLCKSISWQCNCHPSIICPQSFIYASVRSSLFYPFIHPSTSCTESGGCIGSVLTVEACDRPPTCTSNHLSSIQAFNHPFSHPPFMHLSILPSLCTFIHPSLPIKPSISCIFSLTLYILLRTLQYFTSSTFT